MLAMGQQAEAAREGQRALEAARSEEDRQTAQQFLAMAAQAVPRPDPSLRPAAPAEVAEAVDQNAAAVDSSPAAVMDAVRRARGIETVRGEIVSMACPAGGELVFVVEIPGGRLRLRAAAPDQVFLRRGGALVQMDWKCGPLRVPATVHYVRGKAAGSGTSVDGTVLSFDLAPAP
jgi:hypothetical protein